MDNPECLDLVAHQTSWALEGAPLGGLYRHVTRQSPGLSIRDILPLVTAHRQLASDVLGLHVSVRRVLLVNVDYSSLSFQLNFF